MFFFGTSLLYVKLSNGHVLNVHHSTNLVLGTQLIIGHFSYFHPLFIDIVYSADSLLIHVLCVFLLTQGKTLMNYDKIPSTAA